MIQRMESEGGSKTRVSAAADKRGWLALGGIHLIAFGSFAGEWLGLMQKLGLVQNFWFGHQGYEYLRP